MGDPADRPSHCEDAGETVGRECERFEQEGGVEFDIRLQCAVRLPLTKNSQGGLLDRLRVSEAAGIRIELAYRALQCVGTWVTHAIDAVTEPHQAITALQRGFQPGSCVAHL